MSHLIPFSFDSHTVRVLLDDTGKPWWVAQDVCQVLGIRNTREAMRRLHKDEKGVSRTDTLGGPQEVSIINEPGLYRLIFRSDKLEAQRFQEWVFTEVLPQIRTTGSYGHPTQPSVQNQALQAIIDMAVQLDRTEQRAMLAEATATRAESKADMALNSQEFYTVAEYVYFNGLQRQLPESGYRAASDHLRLYCLDQRIPFRKQLVGGKHWQDEYAYHISTYTTAFTPWLSRRHSQSNLRVLPDKA